MTLWENPIFRREGWPGKWGRRSRGQRWIWALGALSIVFTIGTLAVVVYAYEDVPPLEFAATVSTGKWWLARLLAAILPATAIASERERQTWDQLVLTGMRPRDILIGKCASRLVPSVLCVLFFLPMELVAVVAAEVLSATGHQDDWSGVPGLAAIWYLIFTATQVLALVAYGTMGTWCSTRSRSALNAVISTLVFVAAYGVLCSIPVFFVVWLMQDPWMTLLSGVLTGPIAVPFIWLLWRVMLRRFNQWDAEVRGGSAPARRVPRNIVVPEGIAP